MSRPPIAPPRAAARSTTPPRRARRTGRLVSTALLLLAAACGDDDPFRSPAQFASVVRSASVFAFTGGPPGLPAALDLLGQRPVRPTIEFSGGTNFQIAFDFDGSTLRLFPAQALVAPPGGAPGVAVQRAGTTFDLLELAPESGYATDSTYTAAVGDTWIVQLPGAGCFFNEPFYAKVTVDSVLTAERRIVVRTLINRNCGYRALTIGLPDD